MSINWLNVSMRIFTRNHRDMRFCADGIMITNNSNKYYVMRFYESLGGNVFMGYISKFGTSKGNV